MVLDESTDSTEISQAIVNGVATIITQLYVLVSCYIYYVY